MYGYFKLAGVGLILISLSPLTIAIYGAISGNHTFIDDLNSVMQLVIIFTQSVTGYFGLKLIGACAQRNAEKDKAILNYKIAHSPNRTSAITKTVISTVVKKSECHQVGMTQFEAVRWKFNLEGNEMIGVNIDNQQEIRIPVEHCDKFALAILEANCALTESEASETKILITKERISHTKH